VSKIRPLRDAIRFLKLMCAIESRSGNSLSRSQCADGTGRLRPNRDYEKRVRREEQLWPPAAVADRAVLGYPTLEQPRSAI